MQNEQIEQEFFEAFGIEPTCERSCLDCPDFETSKNGIEWANRPCPNNCEFLSERNYPPITPEIVLGLMQIILEYIDKKNEEHVYHYFLTKYKVGNKYAFGMQHSENDEIIGEYPEYGKTNEEAMLSLCLKLKDEIKEDIKKIF
jgi:hypothetical protein